MDKDEEFDYFQEVARSAFADMLHDEERNRKYSQGLKWAIDLVKSQGKRANVLDIGTGSGLLAMLAARHGADSVVTLEAFSPTSTVAKKVIETNGYGDKIKIVNKHSTQVKVGAGKDMEQKANILVAEVLDTELIGEGAIRTYNEAHQHLLEEDCLCVPHSAEIYVQVVDSKLASSWFKFNEISFDETIIRAPKDVSNF
jgi:protein arginine N-methyltransferase 7